MEIQQNEITYVFVEIVRHESGFGVGIELTRKEEGRYRQYAIMSLFFPAVEFTSKRQLFFHLLSEIFRYIPESDKLVLFRSTLNYFHFRAFELKSKAAQFAGGRVTSFKFLKRRPTSVKWLATDAIARKSNIIEEL